MDTRRIDKDDLGILVHHDNIHPFPGCLSLLGDHRELLTHQMVKQCTFTGIGTAYDRNKSGFGLYRFIGHNFPFYFY